MTRNKRNQFDKVEISKYIPEKIDEGVLYISMEYGTCVHLCPCGCGMEIAIPVGSSNPKSWSMVIENNLVTFSPSLLNYNCNAHYFIRDNQVVWC